MGRAFFISSMLLLVALPSTALGQEDDTYQERLEFDAKSGQWREVAPPIPGTDAGDLAIARSLLAKNAFKKARKEFQQWFKTYPDSPLLPEALYYAAETEVSADDAKPRAGDLVKAYEWLEQLIAGWPSTELSDRALRKELIIAEMLLFKNRKQKIWKGMLWLSGREEGLQILDRIIDQTARETQLAEQALRLKADYHYLRGDFEEAETAYARLMRDFPRGRYHKIAMLRSGDSAMARCPGAEFDEADLLEADAYFRDFQAKYPKDAAENNIPLRLSGVNERLAEKEYTIGRFYERTHNRSAAIYYFKYVIDRFEGTVWATEAQSRLIALGVAQPETTEDHLDVGPLPDDTTTETRGEPIQGETDVVAAPEEGQ